MCGRSSRSGATGVREGRDEGVRGGGLVGYFSVLAKEMQVAMYMTKEH